MEQTASLSVTCENNVLLPDTLLLIALLASTGIMGSLTSVLPSPLKNLSSSTIPKGTNTHTPPQVDPEV